jgi:hypothetical protein
MGMILKFYSTLIWLGISMALAGQLKGCTLQLMGMAAENTQHGLMSYAKFNRLLTTPAKPSGRQTKR